MVAGVILSCLFLMSVGLGIGLSITDAILMDLQQLNIGGRVAAAVIGVVFAVLAATMFRMAMYRSPVVKAVIKETQFGKVRITVDAIRDLVIKAVRQIEGIKTAEVDVQVTEENLSLNLTLCILPDIDISAISETVQATLQDYVHATVGISLSQIDILVKNVVPEKKSRVE